MKRLYVLSDFDLCECQDYRHQHKPGACGFKCSCRGYRHFTEATAIPEIYQRLNEERISAPPVGTQE